MDIKRADPPNISIKDLNLPFTGESSRFLDQDEDEDDEEKEKDRVNYFVKQVFDPIEFEFDSKRISKPNWLKTYLDHLEKKSTSLANESSSTSTSVSKINENLEEEEEERSEIVEYRQNLVKAMKMSNGGRETTNGTNKLFNFGNSVKTANTSSKTCVLS